MIIFTHTIVDYEANCSLMFLANHVWFTTEVYLDVTLKYCDFSAVSISKSNNRTPDNKVHGANMGPVWADRTQVGPMLAPWTLLSGTAWKLAVQCFIAGPGELTEYFGENQWCYNTILSTDSTIGIQLGVGLPNRFSACLIFHFILRIIKCFSHYVMKVSYNEPMEKLVLLFVNHLKASNMYIFLMVPNVQKKLSYVIACHLKDLMISW